MWVARSQGVGVGKNWVLGISVGTNRGPGRVRRLKETGGLARFVSYLMFYQSMKGNNYIK